MQSQWTVIAAVSVALSLGPDAVAADQEQISQKLLEQAKAKVASMERLISAAKEGNAESQYELGRMIFEESEPSAGVDEAALVWLLHAAQQGHLSAQWMVCEMYRRVADNRYTPNDEKEEGFGEKVKKAKVHAYAWDRVLVRSKGEETIEFYNNEKYTRVELLSGHMTNDEVAEAERLSREFEREIQRRSAKVPR